MKENVLNISNNLFFKWALGLSLLSIALYILDDPRVAPNGGTWLGYTLGTIGALTIVFLTLFGVRKRSYRSNLGDLKYWLSAHVWLGLALVVIATLHTGFQFGWNVHTLAYVLTMLVVFSGIWGVYMYLRFPSLMSELLNSKTLIQQGEVLIEIIPVTYISGFSFIFLLETLTLTFTVLVLGFMMGVIRDTCPSKDLS